MEDKSKYSRTVWVVTILAMIGGFYLIYKHHKSEGFWYGFLAVLLLSTYLVVKPDGFKVGAGGFSIETSAKEAGSETTTV